MPIQSPSNEDIATLLEQIAGQLEQQEDNPYRVQAFRRGAENVRRYPTPLTELISQDGGRALTQIEGIGQGLATTIFEFIETGRSGYLQQLQANQRPEERFIQIPGIGPKLAWRIVHYLEISSLEALQQAAHDGRLEGVDGFGPKNVASIRRHLTELLGHPAQADGTKAPAEAQPSVSLLLAADADYRRQAEAGELPLLTPRRFNPTHEAWLPLLRTEREGWAMTLLFSNTAHAHELGQTRDWVVIYYQKDGPEDQCTVVTETTGRLAGKRVVRGREKECWQFYQQQGRG